MNENWFVIAKDSANPNEFCQYGPIDEAAVVENLKKKQFSLDDFAWHTGLKDWQKLSWLFEENKAAKPQPKIDYSQVPYESSLFPSLSAKQAPKLNLEKSKLDFLIDNKASELEARVEKKDSVKTKTEIKEKNNNRNFNFLFLKMAAIFTGFAGACLLAFYFLPMDSLKMEFDGLFPLAKRVFTVLFG